MESRSSLVRRHPIAAFVVVAYAFSWTAWGIQYAQTNPTGPVGTVLFVVGGLGPLVAGGVVSWFAGTFDEFRDRLFRWRVTPFWYAVALLGPVVAGTAFVAVDSFLVDGRVSFDGLAPLATLPGFVVTGILLGGLEEPGWRGFAQSRLQRRYGALVASLGVAATWVVWHLPLFVVPGTSQSELPFAPFAGMGVALAVVFAWIFNSAGESVPVVVLFHGAYNGVLSWSGLLGDDPVVRPLTVLVVGLWIVALALTIAFGPATLSPGSGSSPGSTGLSR